MVNCYKSIIKVTLKAEIIGIAIENNKILRKE